MSLAHVLAERILAELPPEVRYPGAASNLAIALAQCFGICRSPAWPDKPYVVVLDDPLLARTPCLILVPAETPVVTVDTQAVVKFFRNKRPRRQLPPDIGPFSVQVATRSQALVSIGGDLAEPVRRQVDPDNKGGRLEIYDLGKLHDGGIVFHVDNNRVLTYF